MSTETMNTETTTPNLSDINPRRLFADPIDAG